MGLFYTGKGDKGESYIGPNKVDKTSLPVHTLGELDELNSLIGVPKAMDVSDEFRDILHGVQENLFIIQANVASLMLYDACSDKNEKIKLPKPPKFSEEKVKEVEEIIDRFEKEVEPEKGFVISGANEISANLDYIRAVSRRVERSVLVFSKSYSLPAEIKAYLNRLSSLFFALARLESKREDKKEDHPKYK